MWWDWAQSSRLEAAMTPATPGPSRDVDLTGSDDSSANTTHLLQQLVAQMTQLDAGLMSISRWQMRDPSSRWEAMQPSSWQQFWQRPCSMLQPTPTIAPHVGVIPPHVSTKTQQCVKNGEFVNLPDLLQEEPVELKDFSDATHKAWEKRESTINNFIIWLQAWPVFEGLVMHFHPDP